MVMGHVIGGQSYSGLRVADDSWYRYFYLSLAPMRMPLFTVISGYVYAMRPVVRERAGVFLVGKARRLLLPLVSVSTVQFLVSVYSPGVVRDRALSDIWRIYFFPFDQFWFLQAIALVFLCIFAMELTGLLRNKWGWAFCLLVGAVLYLDGPRVTFFSIDGWCRLLVFFILGVGLNRFDLLSRGRWTFGVAAALLAVTATLHQLALFGWLDPGAWMLWITLGLGLSATFLLIRLRFSYKPLAVLGGFAFTIYLLHSFGVGPTRVFSMKLLGVDQRGVLFVACLLAGLSLPIVGHWVLAKHALTRRVFLGLR
jgi:fucose 4-O-acetylase-like acetyltransferase